MSTRARVQRRIAKAQAAIEWSKPVQIEVEGVPLTVTQTATKHGTYVIVKRVIGRDRKRKIDITCGIETMLEKGNEGLRMIAVLRNVAGMLTTKCTCDYGYGFSDHAEHCFSIYKATDPGECCDDD